VINIDLYFSKVPHDINEVMPGKKKTITCLSYYSYYLAYNSDVRYVEFDYIAIDGILVKKLYNLIHKNKTMRISTDMTSLVPLIIDYAITNDSSIYFLGAKQKEIERFVKTIKQSFPKLNIAGYRNGYFSSIQERLEFLREIKREKADIVFIGTGAPLQDKMSLELKSIGFEGTVYTCGGFIHQTQTDINYYPSLINKLNLRLLYRIFNERNVIKKIFPAIFVFLYHYCKYCTTHLLKTRR
jgi:N-acetylglucosaminyldiphosphoundecaprenol N-acetyl-beta-D-mannosaminyltransferase